MIKELVRISLNKLNLLSSYTLRKCGPLYEDGWFRSFREKRPVDLKGNPIPWFTYPAIEFLANRVKPGMLVFEYGCGYSTLWWSSKVKHVIACEHNKEGYDYMCKLIPGNVELYLAELEQDGLYSKKILDFNMKFDITVIDGRDRVNCALNAINALKHNGIIIWDNSDRGEYKKGYDFLFDMGFKKINFVGMGPIVNLKTETSIFYRQNNCLDI